MELVTFIILAILFLFGGKILSAGLKVLFMVLLVLVSLVLFFDVSVYQLAAMFI